MIELARNSDESGDLVSAIAYYDLAERTGNAGVADLVNFGVLLAELCSRGPAIDPELTDLEARYFRGRYREVLVAASKGLTHPHLALEAQFWMEYWAFILDSEPFDEAKWHRVLNEQRSAWPAIYFGATTDKGIVTELVRQVESGDTAKSRYAQSVIDGWK